MMLLFWFVITVIQEVFASNTLNNGGYLTPFSTVTLRGGILPNGDGSYEVDRNIYNGYSGGGSPNYHLISSNEEYIAIFQKDGNLVIYTNPNVYGGLYVVWAATKNFANPERLLMTNGELQACDTSKAIRWMVSTSASSSSYLKLDNDGRLRIYDGNYYYWTSSIGMKPTVYRFLFLIMSIYLFELS